MDKHFRVNKLLKKCGIGEKAMAILLIDFTKIDLIAQRITLIKQTREGMAERGNERPSIRCC